MNKTHRSNRMTRKGRSRLPRVHRNRKRLRQLALACFLFGFLWTGLMNGSTSYSESESVALIPESSIIVDEISSVVPKPPFKQVLHDVLRPEHSDAQQGAAIEWDLPNLDHERVDYWVERFTTDKREDFARFLQRKGRYESMIREKLAARNMPQDLVYLAMIESGFRAKAYSPAHASGLWQFIAPTGERYGLDINRAVDERNDPEKATDAALSYLQDLHERFDSWYLAAAAYNTGENRVGRIMREVTGSERGSETSYYRIWDRLPRETRDYVPLMIAAARISKQPERYGFEDVEPQTPPPVEVIEAAPATPLVTIARRAGTSVEEIKELNPQLKLDRTRNDQHSEIRIPSSAGVVTR